MASSSSNYSLSEIRLIKPKPVRFVCKAVQTTFGELRHIIGAMCSEIDAALRAARVVPSGALTFNYKDVAADRTQPFTLEIGYPVGEAVPVPVDLRSCRLESAQSAVAIYIGSSEHIGAAWSEFFVGKLAAGRYRPSNESRERYLYWEDAASAHNIIMFETVLEQ